MPNKCNIEISCNAKPNQLKTAIDACMVMLAFSMETHFIIHATDNCEHLRLKRILTDIEKILEFGECEIFIICNNSELQTFTTFEHKSAVNILTCNDWRQSSDFSHTSFTF